MEAGLALVEADHAVTIVVAVVVLPLVQRTPPGVHKEIGNCGDFQAQLLGDGCLHLLAGTFGFLEYSMQCSPLDVGEDQTRLFWGSVLLWRFVHIQFLALAGYGQGLWRVGLW